MSDPSRYYSSTAVRTTLSASINSSATSVTVASSSGFPALFPFTLVLEKDSANEEIVNVTAAVGAAYTIARGFDGTTGRSHSAGTSVEHAVSAKDFTDFRTHEAAAANVHDIGAGASVVGTTTAQTLTNKTLGGNLAAGGFKVTGLADPTNAQDAATKNWAETAMTSQLTAATTQATNSGTSATASANSATASASSATASQASRVASETARDAALASETSATASQSSATASATTATTQAGISTTQAGISTTQAGISTAQAVISTTQATNSAASASAASGSATSAASSAAAAASALDSFDDRYLGAKATTPTVDNDGNALVQGALFYLNTGASEVIGMYVYDGAGWLKASAASVASIITYEYTATASQTVFSGADSNSLSLAFTTGLLQVFLNGVLLNPGDDFTTGVNTVTLVTGAASGDSLTVIAYASFNVGNTYTIAQVDAAFTSAASTAASTYATQAQLATAGFNPFLLIGA
jgi:hypothetical protein